MAAEVIEHIRLSETLETEHLAKHFPHLAETIGGLTVLLVRADTEKSGSFKSRGAENAISKLPQSTQEVVTASAGNHARGVAAAAARCGLRATIVVPNSAPEQKSKGIYQLWNANHGRPGGLQVVKYGDTFDESLAFTLDKYPDAHFIHPYDDLDVIEGQGSLMHDVKEAVPDATDVVMPVGGGGLITGMFLAANGVNVWGVEAKGSDSLSRSLKDPERQLLEASAPNEFYAGSAVLKTSRHGLNFLRANGFTTEQLTTANDAEVLDLAMHYYTQGECTGAQLEPTSLVAIAGLMKLIRAGRFSKHSVIAVVGTGHNENPINLVHAYKKQQHRTLGGYIGQQ
jgi:threonine dehydratase